MYRGQRNASWSLLPSILRPEKKGALENESNIYHSFFTRGFPFFREDPKDWEVLSFMQHYRLPTRLLDWSDSFGVALYFAVSGQKFEEPEDAAVWILHGTALSEKATGQPNIYSVHVEAFPKYSDHFVETRAGQKLIEWPYELPAAFECAWIHERLRSQRGLFTVHGRVEKPLESLASEVVKKIVVPKTAIKFARQYLRYCGIDHFAVFPDLEGLSASIFDEYCGFKKEDWNNLLIY